MYIVCIHGSECVSNVCSPFFIYRRLTTHAHTPLAQRVPDETDFAINLRDNTELNFYRNIITQHKYTHGNAAYKK